jgi:hypothetical protein
MATSTTNPPPITSLEYLRVAMDGWVEEATLAIDHSLRSRGYGWAVDAALADLLIFA